MKLELGEHAAKSNQIKSYLMGDRDKSRPSYYRLRNGCAASAAEFFERPQELIKSIQNRSQLKLKHKVAIAALKFFALIGMAISRLIYCIKGERIKQIDYQKSFDAWMKKDFFGLVCVKEFIDSCIANRILADECKFDAVIVKYDARFCIFSADGCAPGLLANELERTGKNALILFSRQLLSDYLPPVEIKKKLIKSLSDDKANRLDVLAKRCHVVYFTPESPTNQKVIEEMRQLLTHDPI